METNFAIIGSTEEISSEELRKFIEANDYTKVVDIEYDHFDIVQYRVRLETDESEHYLEFDERFDLEVNQPLLL